jgi:hypothetical protein
MKRVYYTILAVLMTAALTSPTRAQNSEESSGVTIEIRDGKVFVNGEEAGDTEDGKMVIEREDGEDLTVYFGGEGGRVWVGTNDDDNELHFRGRTLFGRDGAFGFRMRDDDAELDPMDPSHGSMLMESSPNAFFFQDGANLRERLEGLRGDPLSGAYSVGRANVWTDFPGTGVMKLEREISALARRVRHADEADRAQLETELDELIAEAFDNKLQAERERVSDMQQRLQEARERIDERASARDDIIARKKGTLLGKKDPLDW